MITLDGISLPNFVWQDEYGWIDVAEAVDYSVAGSLVINTGVRSKGMPITLGGDHAWLPRATIEALYQLARQNKSMTLIIGVKEYQVRFRYNDKPVEIVPVLQMTPDTAGSDDLYQVTIRLREV